MKKPSPTAKRLIDEAIDPKRILRQMRPGPDVLVQLIRAAREVLLNTAAKGFGGRANPGGYPPPKRSLDKLRQAIADAEQWLSSP